MSKWPSAQPSSAGLSENFRTRFDIVPAFDETLRDAAYRLRHAVYCEDLGFEPLQADRRETDRYDEHSTPILVRHVPTAEFVACARLVRPRPDAPQEPLPFELTCRSVLDARLLEMQPLARDKVAEVSRLAVISKFRRRKGEARAPVGIGEQDFDGGRFPYILIGLYLGVVAVGQQQGVERLYLLSEPRLADHFARLGVNIVQIGGPVEHRGTRIPSMISVPHLVDGLNRYVKPLYEVILAQVAAARESQALNQT
jgi:N-acyl amino acid synthase of PEP-CTERM/exosortase system